MDEIARLTPTFAGVSFAKIDEPAASSGRATTRRPEGTPTMHVDEFVRQGQVLRHRVRADRAGDAPVSAAPHHRPHPVAIQRRRADAAHAERHVGRGRRARDSSARRRSARHQGRRHGRVDEPLGRDRAAGGRHRSRAPGVVYTTFHFPESGANVVTTENSDWATNCPEYKVTAVEIVKVNQPSEWQKRFHEFTEQQLELLKGREATHA